MQRHTTAPISTVLSSCKHLVRASTPSTSTSHTLHRLAILNVLSRDSANASALMNIFLGLDAPQTAQILVALFPPLRNQIHISVALFQQIGIQLLGDGLFFVVEIVNVPGPLVVDSEHVPEQLVLLFSFAGLVLCVFQLVGEFLEHVFNVGEAGRGLFVALG